MIARATLLFATVAVALAYGSTPEKLFERGNEFYKHKQYTRAIDAYDSILQLGLESAELYYNLGAAHYRAGSLGYARLNFERALRLDPGDEDARHNVAIVKMEAIDDVEALPSFFIFEWQEALVSLFSANGWMVVAYIFFLLALATAAAFLFGSPTLKRRAFFAGIPTLALFAIVVALAIGAIHKDINREECVIVASEVTAKTSPDRSSADAFVAHEALKARVEDKVDDWYRIRLEDGKVGWTPASAIEII
jgi:tetratricopeptide (TPR) repeat protein